MLSGLLSYLKGVRVRGEEKKPASTQERLREVDEFLVATGRKKIRVGMLIDGISSRNGVDGGDRLRRRG